MRLLVYDWGAWFRDDFYEVLKNMGITYELFRWNFNEHGHDKNEDSEFVEWFINNINCSGYDAVMSINYWPPISVACEKSGIKYISWSYDSPIDIKKPEDTFGNSCNYIFLYDKWEAEKYISKGLSNVYHMPLGVNVDRLSKYDSHRKECDKYRSEISFIGGLYNNSFGDLLKCVDESTKNVLLKIVEVQGNMPSGSYVIDQLLTDGFVTLVSDQVTSAIEGFETITKNQLEFSIAQEITRRERIILLNLCGKRYETDLYSGQTFDILKGVNQKSTVDYTKEMPLVFAASKINLNPALFAIRTGVSLRAFDIMACGGFLLTNYKEEYKELFSVGKEMELYTSMGDAIEKIDYYLSHEEERAQIAKEGRLRVKSDHRMDSRIKEMLKLARV